VGPKITTRGSGEMFEAKSRKGADKGDKKARSRVGDLAFLVEKETWGPSPEKARIQRKLRGGANLASSRVGKRSTSKRIGGGAKVDGVPWFMAERILKNTLIDVAGGTQSAGRVRGK